MIINEVFAVFAYWLGASTIAALLLLTLMAVMWKVLQEAIGLYMFCLLLIAARQAGGIEKAIEKLTKWSNQS